MRRKKKRVPLFKTVFFNGQYPWKHPDHAAERVAQEERQVKIVAQRAKTAHTAASILELLRTVQEITALELAAELQVDIQAVRRRLRALVASGVILQNGDQHKSISFSLVRTNHV